ncbi:hypothetical protein NPIL_585371, partial [Nephila pilipes]
MSGPLQIPLYCSVTASIDLSSLGWEVNEQSSPPVPWVVHFWGE